MKRTPIKRKTRLKAKTPLRGQKRPVARRKSKKRGKTKKPSIRLLKDKLWAECKRIIRARYQNQDGSWHCYTCGRRIDEPAKAQTGHFIPSAACGAYLRYDLRNLRVQDYFCNINLGGNGAVFYNRLVNDEGQAYVDQLFKDKNIIIKADADWYLSKIEEYRAVEN